MSTSNPGIENPGPQDLRKFGFVSASIVAVLFGILLPWIFGFQWPSWPWIVAGVLGLWALVLPGSLIFVYRPWLKFGQVAGWINTRIVLGILFYLVFFPVGVIMRLVKNDPMRRKLDKNARSYRIDSTPVSKDHVERPY